MNKEIIEDILNEACILLYNDHKNVIDQHLHERTIVSDYIAPFLRNSFSEFDVNVEYNREGINLDPKKDLDGGILLPDIVIHKQGLKDFNFVSIEVKGYWNKEDRFLDEDKLKRLKAKHLYKFLYRIELGRETYQIIPIL